MRQGSGWTWRHRTRGLPREDPPLQKARKLDRLSDKDMVALQRQPDRSGLAQPIRRDFAARLPPHKYVDHTHSTAILAIADQAESGDERKDIRKPLASCRMSCRASLCQSRRESSNKIGRRGLILDKHGISRSADRAEAMAG